MISSNFKKRLNTSLFLFLILILIFNYNFLLVFTLIVLGVLGIIEFLSISKKIFKNKLYVYLSNTIFIIYIFILCTLFFYFSNFYELKNSSFHNFTRMYSSRILEALFLEK